MLIISFNVFIWHLIDCILEMSWTVAGSYVTLNVRVFDLRGDLRITIVWLDESSYFTGEYPNNFIESSLNFNIELTISSSSRRLVVFSGKILNTSSSSSRSARAFLIFFDTRKTRFERTLGSSNPNVLNCSFSDGDNIISYLLS